MGAVSRRSAAKLGLVLVLVLELGLGLGLVPGIAHGGPCEHDLTPPAEVGLRAAGLGAPRTACVEKTLRLDVLGAAAIDVPSFYGTLGTRVALGVRWPARGWEISGDLYPAELQFSQNASIKATELGVGGGALGALRSFAISMGGHAVVVAPAVRLVLPLQNSMHPTFAGAAELAVHAATRPLAWLTVDGHLSAAGEAYAPAGGYDGLAGVTLGGGAGAAPVRWFAAHAGLEAGAGWHGGFDHLLARVAVHFRVGASNRMVLGVAAPLAGAERTDLVIGLSWIVLP